MHDNARKRFIKFHKLRCQRLKISENQFDETNDAALTSLYKNSQNFFHFYI